MGLRQNFIYNYSLLFFNYLFPVIVFPYISRVLGVNNIGICNFVDSLVNYAILFTMMGIGMIGTREISNARGSSYRMNIAFSSLVALNALFAAISLIVYLAVTMFSAAITEYRELLYIGSLKIVFYIFLIEWFYQGSENFRYITIRTIFVKVLYIIALFLFVRSSGDIVLYYLLTTLTVVINAIINWRYKTRFVKFSFSYVRIAKYLKPTIVIGVYLLLVSMYNTFNVTFLGLVSDTTQVGYYTTATKLYTIVLGFYTAFTGVLIPRCCGLIAEGQNSAVMSLLRKSFEFLYAVSLPVICYSLIFSSQIIRVLAGPEYDGAILPMRIVMPLLLVNGIAQILVLQALMSHKKDKAIFINSFFGALVGIALNILLVWVLNLQSVGSVIVLLVSEIVVTISADYFVEKYVGSILNFRYLLKQLIFSIPYALGCWVVIRCGFGLIATLIAGCIICLVYFYLLHFVFNRNSIIKDQALQIYAGFKMRSGRIRL